MSCTNTNYVKKKFLLHYMIMRDNSDFRIWRKLDNGCFIGTLGYTEENAQILLKLLQSFAEQYGEEVNIEAAREELSLYARKGKLFIYFDENLNPVSMNGVTYNEENVSVDFKSMQGRPLKSIYFYGLSTVKEYRGRGACNTLVNFAIEYAYSNGFDYVYARTDLVDSNSEGIMKRAGMEICKLGDDIIAEWVDVTDSQGDYRLHLWMPLAQDVYIDSKEKAVMADGVTREIITPKLIRQEK